MDNNQGNISVLMLPWLAHGHISPFLELAKKLSNRKFHIYLCSTPINLTSIKKNITEKSIELVELHLPSLPGLPPSYHTTNGLPPHLMSTLKDAFEMASPSFSKILEKLNPDLLIYDFNQPWAAAVAESQNILAVQFLPVAAVMPSFFIQRLKNPGESFPFPEIYFREHEIVKNRKASVHDTKDTDRFFEAVKRSRDIILIKTSREIEGKYIDNLSVLAGKKIVPVGPLVQDSIVDEDERTEIIQWLDKKEKASTVFVSFGSEYFLSNEEIQEVAHGLELSKVNFIWVVRFPVGKKMKVEDVLPEGFLERLGDRGMVVVEWAPQAKILGHSSIGGFVSHCGWGSIMEGIKNGVPIIAIPMHIDQPLNARLVGEIGAGVEVLKDNKGGLVREEIAQVIRKVLIDKSGEKVRIKAKELSDIMKKKGDEEIDGVVEELVQLCRKRNKKLVTIGLPA